MILKAMINQDDDETEVEEKFNFSSPEDVLIEVWRDDISIQVEIHDILSKDPNVTGAAQYEQVYGGFLNYVILDLIGKNSIQDGWWVVEGMTADYIRGDGYTSDDDMRFCYESLRPASEDEIKLQVILKT